MPRAYLPKNNLDDASPADENEISFAKDEILYITGTEGKWWQARKNDGTQGSKSSLRKSTQIEADHEFLSRSIKLLGASES